MIKYLNELKSLNLPNGNYVIFGSGPLAVRGIRENNDLDVLVTPVLWDDLIKKYPVTKKRDRPDSIYIGNVQILSIDYKNWGGCLPNAEILISDAEILMGLPFVKLKHLLVCKRLMDGEKHSRDVEIIEGLLRNVSS